MDNLIKKNDTVVFSAQSNGDLKAKLGLTMRLNELAVCKDYFSRERKKAPTVEELKFLDDVIESRRNRPDSICPTNVKSLSKELFTSFKDMEDKGALMARNPSKPLSCAQLASVADRYLLRCGACSTLPEGYSLSFHSYKGQYLPSFNGISHNDDGIVVISKCTDPKIVDSTDIYICLYSDNEDAICKVIDKGISCGDIHFASRVDENLLESFLSISDGIIINIDAIASIFPSESADDSDNSENICKSDETDKESNDNTLQDLDDEPEKDCLNYLLSRHNSTMFIVRASRERASNVESLSDQNRIPHKRVAISEGKRQFIVKRSNLSVVCSYDIDFLFRIVPITPLSIIIKEKESIISCNQTDNVVKSEFYANEKSYSCVIGKRDISHGFTDGIYSVLNGIGHLIEMGYDLSDCAVYTKHTAPVTPSIDEQSQNRSSLISALAGVYRAKAELALGGGGECVFEGDEKSTSTIDYIAFAPCISKYSISQEKSEETKRYLLKASKGEESIPNMKNVRDLLGYITSLRKESKVKSIKYVGGLMAKNVLDASEDKTVLDFAFVIEAFEPILGILI